MNIKYEKNGHSIERNAHIGRRYFGAVAKMRTVQKRVKCQDTEPTAYG